MGSKPESGKVRGLFAEIRSFVFTLIVVAFGFAFITSLFTGGIGGAEEFVVNVLHWALDFVQNFLNTLRGFGAEARQ